MVKKKTTEWQIISLVRKWEKRDYFKTLPKLFKNHTKNLTNKN